ncbi:MAG: flavohemoglobin expression-modulating QEGLA motif protein [Planctomycetota bacterium]
MTDPPPPGLAELDARLVAAAKDVKVLKQLAWPVALKERFLSGWRAGRPVLPEVPPVTQDLDAHVAELSALARPSAEHPMAEFIARTADSYLESVRMLQVAGTPAFSELSQRIYGRPSDPVVPGGLTSLEAAEHFCEATEELAAACADRESDYCLSAEEVAVRMRAAFEPFFGEHKVEIAIDPDLAAKAAAGAERVRLRAGAVYSENDVEQLVHHEGFVHAATLINGRSQPHLRALGLGAPRTTATQEGLATFSELITTSIDLARLRRIALRIVAVDMALKGADFVQVFEFFHGAGQTEGESFSSTQRVFRGGDPRGGVAFTKDTVYLRGLLETHHWLQAALTARKVDYPRFLFSGRLTWGDVEALEPWLESGWIAPPRFAPKWVTREHNLAAYLAFYDLTHGPLAGVELSNFTTQRYQRRTR